MEKLLLIKLVEYDNIIVLLVWVLNANDCAISIYGYSGVVQFVVVVHGVSDVFVLLCSLILQIQRTLLVKTLTRLAGVLPVIASFRVVDRIIKFGPSFLSLRTVADDKVAIFCIEWNRFLRCCR